MNVDMLEGNWAKLRGRVKQRWGELTEDDLAQIEGKREHLEGKLQERYGYTRAQAQREVDAFLQEANGQGSKARETVQAKVQQAQERVQTTMRDAQERAQQRMSSTKDQMEFKADQYDEQLREVAPEEIVYVVEEYPWLVITAALLLGIVVGLLLGPKRS